MAATARPRPCASCPYRRDVPSGVWAAEEYEKLPGFDGPTGDQSASVFFCHQQDGSVCSGWLGHTDPYHLLGVRLGISMGLIEPSCAEYTTDVPLFASGQEAAEHGVAAIEAPLAKAEQTIRKILTRRRSKET